MSSEAEAALDFIQVQSSSSSPSSSSSSSSLSSLTSSSLSSSSMAARYINSFVATVAGIFELIMIISTGISYV